MYADVMRISIEFLRVIVLLMVGVKMSFKPIQPEARLL